MKTSSLIQKLSLIAAVAVVAAVQAQSTQPTTVATTAPATAPTTVAQLDCKISTEQIFASGYVPAKVQYQSFALSSADEHPGLKGYYDKQFTLALVDGFTLDTYASYSNDARMGSLNVVLKVNEIRDGANGKEYQVWASNIGLSSQFPGPEIPGTKNVTTTVYVPIEDSAFFRFQNEHPDQAKTVSARDLFKAGYLKDGTITRVEVNCTANAK